MKYAASFKINVSFTWLFSTIMIMLPFGIGLLSALFIIFSILLKQSDRFWIDSFLYVAVFFFAILILTLILFVLSQKLINQFKITLILRSTSVNQRGINIDRKNGQKYSWKDVIAVKCFRDDWQSKFVKIIFSDGYSLEIPRSYTNIEHFTGFLNQLYSEELNGAENKKKIKELLEALK